MGIFRVIKILSLSSQRMYLLKQLKTEISRPWQVDAEQLHGVFTAILRICVLMCNFAAQFVYADISPPFIVHCLTDCSLNLKLLNQNVALSNSNVHFNLPQCNYKLYKESFVNRCLFCECY